MAGNYLIMFLAGIGIPLLAALNAALGRHIGSPAAAATVLFVVAFCVALITALVTGTEGFGKLASAPKHLFAAGLFVAFYVLSVTWIAPKIGVGNAIFLVLLGQMASAAVIDHFGLFGAQVRPLNLMRAGGLALMVLGLTLAQRA
ncbi:DMT family transporter [Marivivens donghaensis]|uniref:DMT family transporter n=1 Tax=Marivivens donghaensis TaxID=1699413 RepID=A0ABX0VYM5_9RHOB|nr:DMT family transporter [Marivivens donghaensis]NIY72272.1 DMT family transporter [Marivivens donghaensis]